MLSGRRLDLLDPSPLDVELSDIAHGLARVARWNGQTIGDHAFSVAQHSLLVERIFALLHPEAAPRDRLTTLLHDAPEYVIGDIISPFKAVLDEAYRAVEQRLHAAVHLRFGLPAATPEPLRKRIKKADQAAAYWEAVRLAGFGEAEAERFFGKPGRIALDRIGAMLEPWPAKRAESRYLAAVAELSGEALPLPLARRAQGARSLDPPPSQATGEGDHAKHGGGGES
jgi:5'-deoxynucleotidase YfbR-like HD superfamily hydrolase